MFDPRPERVLGLRPGGIAAIGGAALFLSFTLYCKLHGMITEGEVPLWVSMRWAAATTLCWAGLAAIGWSRRERLRAQARGSAWRQAALFLAAIPAILATDLLSLLIGLAAGGEAATAGEIGARLYGFAPDAAMLSAIMMLGLVLWDRRATPGAAAPSAAASGWIDFPEAPLLRLRSEEVLLVRSAGNYCELVGADRTWLVRAPIGGVAARLQGHGFARVHRQTLVNKRHVRGIGRDRRGRPAVMLSRGDMVAVGRSYRSAIDAITRGD